MNKKPFWKRVNRGLVVFLALVAAVLLYVVVSQISIVPQKAELRKLGDEVCKLAEPYCTPDDALLDQLDKDVADEETYAAIYDTAVACTVDGLCRHHRQLLRGI